MDAKRRVSRVKSIHRGEVKRRFGRESWHTPRDRDNETLRRLTAEKILQHRKAASKVGLTGNKKVKAVAKEIKSGPFYRRQPDYKKYLQG